jgi:hypothetical protein
VRKAMMMGAAVVLSAVLQAGCLNNEPAVPRVPVPAPGRDTEQANYEPNKSMPGELAPPGRMRLESPAPDRLPAR